MIDPQAFYDYLKSKDIDLFAGVPDSLLASLCACIKENSDKTHNIICANEGNAIAVASGYHLASGKYGCVYMQNSGLGNAVNPLLSLCDKAVYSIPLLMIVGWRGQPGTKDEPQHVTQGRLTLGLLETLGIKYVVLTDDYQTIIDDCVAYMQREKQPIALVVEKGTFQDYSSPGLVTDFQLTREAALEVILDQLGPDDFIVSTTGKTSREIFEIREARHQDHSRDFLTVGSMGHTASIGFGMSLASDKAIYVIDGDGSFLMHLGCFPVIAQVAKKNFKYILNNNGAHESVGGQPTVALAIDVAGMLQAAGFKTIYSAFTAREIEGALAKMKDESLCALVLYTKVGSRDDLGRPTKSPQENKEELMAGISER